MRLLAGALLSAILLSAFASAQSVFAVTGTAIPKELVRENYGKLPKGVAAYDLNVCNVSGAKQPVVSSEIYQALTQSNPGLQPIGRQIMLAAILRNQNRSPATVAAMALNAATSLLSVLTSTKYSIPTGIVTGVALGAITAQQLLASLKPVLSADQLAKFEDQVLPSALVLDSGSCVERTVFVAVERSPKGRLLNFHVR